VLAVIPDCAGVGIRWALPSLPPRFAPGFHLKLFKSSSITQSALPAVSALVASNKIFMLCADKYQEHKHKINRNTHFFISIKSTNIWLILQAPPVDWARALL
jgi:hypothetical protein